MMSFNIKKLKSIEHDVFWYKNHVNVWDRLYLDSDRLYILLIFSNSSEYLVLLIIISHRKNIYNLISGKESKIKLIKY